MSQDPREDIQKLIKSHDVFLFVKTHCPNSRAAREALTEAGVDFQVKELDLLPDPEMNAFQDCLRDMTGARTVPRIFVHGHCIGGNSDLQQNYVQTGKIRELCH